MKTVSNVINGYAHVSEPTRTRVLAAVETIGYRPNLSARNLARGRSGVIALVVPRLEMPYFAALASQIVDQAEGLGWFVLIHETGWDRAAERAALEGQFPQRIDGLIVSAQHLRRSDLEGRAATTPLVLLGERTFGDAVHHVAIDNVAAAHTAVGHLVAQGRSKIAMVGASIETTDDPRMRGYLEGLEAAGLPVRPEMILPVAANSGEEGERAIRQLLQSSSEVPDGIFAVTDWVALGVMRALHLHELRVPEDVAVVGFDDIPYARAVTPSLTTIAPDRFALAQVALRMLEAQINGTDPLAEPADRTVPFELVVRESTTGYRFS